MAAKNDDSIEKHSYWFHATDQELAGALRVLGLTSADVPAYLKFAAADRLLRHTGVEATFTIRLETVSDESAEQVADCLRHLVGCSVKEAETYVSKTPCVIGTGLPKGDVVKWRHELREVGAKISIQRHA